MTLDTTITAGQGGHITDHDELHAQINALEAAIAISGDLPIAVAAASLGAIAPGSAGQVLTADPAMPGKAKWATPAPPGAGTDGYVVRNVVRDYGAANNNTGDQSGAINAAEAAGGIVFLPAGTYRCLSTIVLKPSTILLGAGRGLTKIVFPTDLGANTYAIDREAVPATQHLAPQIRDLWVEGPGARTLGVATSSMHGIRPGPHSAMTSVYTSQFNAGIVIDGDHNVLTYCKSSNNYDGVLFADNPLTCGDHTWTACDFTGNSYSSVANSTNNSMSGGFYQCHFGFSPYGFRRFNGTTAGPPGAQPWLYSATFSNCDWEAIGNICLWDPTTVGSSSSIVYVTFDRPGWSSNTDTTQFRIAAASKDFCWDVRAIGDIDIVPSGSMFSPPAGGLATFRIREFSTETVEMSFNDLPLGASQIVSADSVAYSMMLKVAGARATMLVSGGTIAVGDLLTWTGAGNTVARATAGTVDNFAGVAMQAATTGTFVAVALPGSIVYLTSEAIASGGVAIRSLAGTEHHGTSAGSNPIIARSFTSGGAGGGGPVKAILKGI